MGARVRKGDGHQHVILWLNERRLHFNPSIQSNLYSGMLLNVC